jgi:hypothetical protein
MCIPSFYVNDGKGGGKAATILYPEKACIGGRTLLNTKQLRKRFKFKIY